MLYHFLKNVHLVGSGQSHVCDRHILPYSVIYNPLTWHSIWQKILWKHRIVYGVGTIMLWKITNRPFLLLLSCYIHQAEGQLLSVSTLYIEVRRAEENPTLKRLYSKWNEVPNSSFWTELLHKLKQLLQYVSCRYSSIISIGKPWGSEISVLVSQKIALTAQIGHYIHYVHSTTNKTASLATWVWVFCERLQQQRNWVSLTKCTCSVDSDLRTPGRRWENGQGCASLGSTYCSRYVPSE